MEPMMTQDEMLRGVSSETLIDELENRGRHVVIDRRDPGRFADELADALTKANAAGGDWSWRPVSKAGGEEGYLLLDGNSLPVAVTLGARAMDVAILMAELMNATGDEARFRGRRTLRATARAIAGLCDEADGKATVDYIADAYTRLLADWNQIVIAVGGTPGKTMDSEVVKQVWQLCEKADEEAKR